MVKTLKVFGNKFDKGQKFHMFLLLHKNSIQRQWYIFNWYSFTASSHQFQEKLILNGIASMSKAFQTWKFTFLRILCDLFCVQSCILIRGYDFILFTSPWIGFWGGDRRVCGINLFTNCKMFSIQAGNLREIDQSIVKYWNYWNWELQIIENLKLVTK